MNKLFEAVDNAFNNNRIVESETIYNTNLSNYDYLKNNMNADDLDELVKSVAINVLSYDRSDEAVDLGADFKFTDDEIQKGIERLNSLNGDEIALYCYRIFATKYNRLFGIEEGRGWDFKEAANMNEASAFDNNEDKLLDNPLISDMIDMMEEFGWTVTKVKDNVYNVFDGEFTVEMSLKEVGRKSKDVNESTLTEEKQILVDKDGIIEAAEELAIEMNLPTDEWSVEDRAKYAEQVYYTYIREVKADNKLYLDTIEAALQGNLASWFANTLKMNEKAPIEWRNKVIKLVEKIFTNAYELGN